MAYQAGDISCFGEGIGKYFRLFSNTKMKEAFEKITIYFGGCQPLSFVAAFLQTKG
ncbi:MAG: hypothetical protein ABI472_13350 [Ginsengibacter sp.]